MRTRFALGFLAALGIAALRMVAWIPEPGALWPDGVVPVSLELNPTAPNQNVAWNAAVNDSIAAWNGQLQRVQIAAVPSAGGPQYDNGRNELFFSDHMYDEWFPRGVLAVTLTSTDREARVETDIVFNSAERWSVYNGALQSPNVDFRRVALHELGHLLGLSHPDEAGQSVAAVMNSAISATDALTSDDQAGARALYNRGTGAAPVILTHPRTQSAKQGAPGRLTVVAGGRGPLVYSWRRDGALIPGATSSALSWDALTLGDTASYAAVVGNGAGNAASHDAVLTIEPAQLAVVSMSDSVRNLTAGEDLVLYTYISRGDVPMRIEWLCNGNVVSSHTMVRFEHPRFLLAGAQASDSGDYQMRVTNAAGTVTSSTVRVNVAPGVPPRFTSDLPSRAVTAGRPVTLAAPVNAIPAGKYQWKKNGVDLPYATSASLYISNFQPSDVGDYSVTLTNPFGQATSSGGVLTLFNAGALQFLTHPIPVADYVGATMTLSADVGDLNVAYRWFKNDELLPDTQSGPGGTFPLPRISGTRSRTLRIENAALADDAVYSLEISDGVNVLRSRGARLTLLPAPKPYVARHPSHYNVAPGAIINLSIIVRAPSVRYTQEHSLEGLTIQWYKNGAPVEGQTREGFSFAAQPSDTGRYFAHVVSAGGSVDSEVGEVTVAEGAAALLPMQFGNWFVDPANLEEVRLMPIAVDVSMRRAGLSNENFVWTRDGQSLGNNQSPFPLGFVPGTYTLTVTRNGVSETSRPMVFGYQPAIAPVIYYGPESRTVDLGERVEIHAFATAYSPLQFAWSKNGMSIPGATNPTLFFRSFADSDVGTYRMTAMNSLGVAISQTAELQLRGGLGPVITEQPLGQTVPVGSLAALSVSATGGSLRYQWLRDGQPIAGATDSQYHASMSLPGSFAYSVVVSNGQASTTSRVAQVRALAAQRPPEVLTQPTNQTAVVGGDLTLIVGADGAPLPDRYQWKKDGVDIPGATGAKLRLQNVGMESAGSYTAVAFNVFGSATSNPARVTVDGGGRLVNLATRAAVGAGGDVLIAGFVIGGTQPRSVLVRGIGSQLGDFGVGGVLRNPLLRIFDRTSRVIETSDNWARTSNDTTAVLEEAAKQVGAFPLRANSTDSAILTTLAPGTYTAQVSGVLDTTGIALVEIYELGKPDTNRLINLSSRAIVGTGANILIPGLVLSGQAPRRLLLRAVGPGLADFGVERPLLDPVMTVFRDTDVVARNDNWSEQENASAIGQVMASIGAFALHPGSRDAALLLELAPGSYTVQVSGAEGTTGVALVEIYEVKP